MQDPAFSSAAAAGKPQFPEQEQHLKCPRCESTNTKFCYYNNYNLSQPRHFCKNCRRYWTKGGALRNIPVGGGTRKNSKRSAAAAVADTPAAGDSSSPAATAPASAKRPNSSPAITTPTPSFTSTPRAQLPKIEALPGLYSLSAAEGQMIGMSGTTTFSSLLTSNGHFGSLLDNFHHVDHGVLGLPISSDLSRQRGVGLEAVNGDLSQPTHPPPPDNFIGWSSSGGGGDGNDDDGGDGGVAGGWPNLSIYTPGSSFQ